MPKKPKPKRVEVLAPAPKVPGVEDFKRIIAEAVERKVSEVLSSAGADLEPWFQPKKVAYEIRKRQTVTEQRKWSYFFDDWGCVVCGTKDRAHESLGMCSTCHQRTVYRLQSSMRRREKSKAQDERFDDNLRLAREAVAGELPALPERKRGRDETH